MQKPTPRRATYADIEKLPEHLVGELIGGELFVSPRPAVPHARAVTALSADVDTRFGRRRGAGGWWILFEPELHLHGDVLVPDIAGWRRERMPNPPRGVGIELPPDWLCEAMSDSTRRLDRTRKMMVYAREQVPHVWLVEPLDKTVENFRLEGGHYSLLEVFEGAAKVRAVPFESEEIDLGALWLPDEEPPAPATGEPPAR